MTKGAAGGTGSGIALGAVAKGGALAAVVVVAAAVAAHFTLREADAPMPLAGLPQGSLPEAGQGAEAPATVPEPKTPAAPVASEPAAQAQIAALPDGVADPDTGTGTEDAPGAPGPAMQTPPAIPPGFDLLRMEPDGSGLVAGRAQPGSRVVLLVDGQEAGSAEAGATGGFAIFFTLPPSEKSRLLTLRMRLADGSQIASVDQVVLAPGDVVAFAPVAEAPPADASRADTSLAEAPHAEATPDVMSAGDTTSPAADLQSAPDLQEGSAATPTAAAEAVAVGQAPELADPAASSPSQAELSALSDAATSVAAAPAAPGLPATPEAPAAADAPPSAPQTGPEMAAILMGPDGVRVLQPGATAAPGQLRPVTIDAISYTATGAVQMAGRGMPGQAVRLYLNNQPLTEFPVAADGGWGGVLPEVAPGRYTLRADQIGAEGVVTARFETPFQRETLAALAAATGRPVEDDPSSGKPVAGADISGAATSGDRPAADPAPVTVAAVSSAADGTAEPAQGAATRPATAPPAPTTAPVPTAELLVPAGTAPTAQPATRTETVAVPQPAPVLAPAVEPAAPQPDLVAGTTVATVPAAVPATSPAPPAAAAPVSVTVQPGFTLWAIARDQLGEGVLYVQVFEANRDRIRDPDLIYPGQVFAIPERASP